MNFSQIKPYCLPALRFTWVGMFLLQFLTFPNKTLSKSIETESKKVICPSENSIPRRNFETAKYQVYICIGNQKHPLGYYVRITKTDGAKITVPLTRRNGETYVAAKNEITYAITPYEMLVIKQGRTVVRERVESLKAADGQPLVSRCPEGQNLLVEAVTRSFIVYICGVDIPGSYVAITRSDNSKITLPLLRQKAQEGAISKKYVAVKGSINYTLTRDVLRVSQDGQIMIKEKVLRWY
jgi:hypothetical protein